MKRYYAILRQGLARFAFTLSLAKAHCQALTPFLQKTWPLSCPQVTQLDFPALYESGIRVLILDFDGVLAAHGAELPTPEVEAKLEEARSLFQLFILSNRPCPKRMALLQHRYPWIHYVMVDRKKPYPDGFEAVMKSSHCQAEQILMVDDRLFTGVLMAVSQAGRACWITQAYQNYRLHPIQEAFFACLRYMDTLIIRLLG